MLFPKDAKPQKTTASLLSTDRRVGNEKYQVFYLRSNPKREAFRVNIGSYETGQLVADWNYGIVLEKDLHGAGHPDFVWYGGDDTGQRLYWFSLQHGRYQCTDVLKSAEAAWRLKFGTPAPDLGEVFGNTTFSDVIWDEKNRILTVSADTNAQDQTAPHIIFLRIPPARFVSCDKR